MSCRLYINQLTKNPKVQSELEKLHNAAFKKIADSKLFNKWNGIHFLPTGIKRFNQAKQFISELNKSYGKPIVGTSFTKANSKEYVFVNVRNFVKDYEDSLQNLEIQQVDEFGDSTPEYSRLGIKKDDPSKEYFDISRSKFEEKDKIISDSGAKIGKYGYYYTLTKEQQEQYNNYQKKHPKSIPGYSYEGFELSRNLSQTVRLKKVRGKNYLFIDLKHLINRNGVLLPQVYGKVKIPIDLVFHGDLEKYLKSFEKEEVFISEQEAEIRKILFKTKGISAPRAANFYLFNIKEALVKLVKNLGGNISYSDFNNLDDESIENIKSLVNIDKKVEDLVSEYKSQIDKLDDDELRRQIISIVESEYDEKTLQGIWKVLNNLPTAFLKLLSFEFIDDATAFFRADNEENIENEKLDINFLKEKQYIIMGASINVALRRMLDDGFVSEKKIDELNNKIRKQINKVFKPKEGKLLTADEIKRQVRKSQFIKDLDYSINYKGQTLPASYVFNFYRDKAVQDIEEYIIRQNKGIVDIVDFIQKLNHKKLNRVYTNVTLGKLDSIQHKLKFPVDYTVIAAHELGHALDYYLQTTKPEIRSKLNEFISRLSSLDEFQNYLEKGLYSRNYNISDTKEIAADLYAWLMAKSANYDISQSHISSLDQFMNENEVMVENIFKEIFNIKTPERPKNAKIVESQSVIDYIKDLIKDLVNWVNDTLGVKLYSSKDGEIKTEPAGAAVQRLLKGLDRLTMRDDTFDIQSILDSQSQKFFFRSLIEKQGIVNNIDLVDEALSLSNNINPDWYRPMLEKNPRQFLFEMAQQLNSSKSEADTAKKILGSRLTEIALTLFPNAKVGDKLDDIQYDRVEYEFKAASAILKNIDKIRRWEKEVQTPPVIWSKIQKDLGIPKDQVNLIEVQPGETVEEKLMNFINSYSFAVEIETAVTDRVIPEDIFILNRDTNEYTFRDSDKKFYIRKEVEGLLTTIEISEQEFKNIVSEEYYNSTFKTTSNTDFYSTMTTPGGTNYTENNIITPAITPSIKGHAQFATDNSLMWARTDERIQYQENEIDNLLKIMENSKVLQIKCF